MHCNKHKRHNNDHEIFTETSNENFAISINTNFKLGLN